MMRREGSGVVLVALAMTFALGCSGTEGPIGPQGPAGDKGDVGSSCTVTDNGGGAKTIACEDGTSVIVNDGGRGPAGTNCTVVDNQDGTKTVSCGDGTSVTVSDGVVGEDGASCTVTDNDNGTKTISCEDGTSAVVSDGAAGGSCSVADNGDGTKTITCEDDTSVVVSDGAPGTSAAFLFNLAAEMPKALFVTFTEPPTIASPPVVKFTVRDAAGRGAVGIKTAHFRFTLAKLVPAANGDPAAWIDYIRSASGGPSSDRNGTLVDNGDGSYIYTFVTNVTAVPSVTWEPELTHRLAMQVSGSTAAGTLPWVNALYDWVPAGGTVLKKEVATTAACNDCHGELVLHGSRTEVGYCVMCHAKDVVDPNGVNIDMAHMTHAIHAAHMRNDLGADPYMVKSSYSGNTYDYSHVTYPMPLNNCLKCHNQADSAQGDNWKKFPSPEACGACHATTEWTTHNPDIACTTCHTENAISRVHASENNTPNATQVIAGASNFVYEIMKVEMADATHPVITFKITRDGAAMDVTTLPADLTGGPSFLLVWAAPTPSDDPMNFNPADWNNYPRSAAQPLSVSLANLRSGTAGTLAVDAVNTGFYTATLTGANAFPADSKLRAAALQGYFSQTGITGVTGSLGRHTLGVVKGVTGDTQRRQVIDDAKCGACHEWFEGHGGNRVAGLGSMSDANICAACHVPNLTTSGRGADPATVLARLATAGSDIQAMEDAGYDPEDPLTFPEVTNNLKEMIHAIHGSAKRTTPFQEVRDRGTSGVFYYDFSHITYPNHKDACLACHKAGTYSDVPMGAAPTAWVTSNGVNDRTNILAARGTLPNDQDIVATPFASACFSCHDTPLAAAHMEQNGALVARERSMITPAYVETCALCHGPGRTADTKVAHGL
jgi:OmcA/MtrC family decaheme c-type cytochrome